MVDLIFHIGLPKCASTTLQNEVFAKEKGYLGTRRGLELSDNYGKQFEYLSPTGPRFLGDINGALELLNGVINEFKNERRLILSSELLSNRNKLKSRPIIDFLRTIKRKSKNEVNIKVLMILRNPVTRIVSEYAQISSRNRNACQKDFENYVEKALVRRNFMEYDKWVYELQKSFGKDKVCILFVEEMNSYGFWFSLKNFCSLETLDIEEKLKLSVSLNERKQDNQTWKLSEYDARLKAHGLVSSAFALVWPIRFLPRLRSALLRNGEGLLYNYFAGIYSLTNKNTKELHVKLNTIIAMKVVSKYRTQIERLEELLDRDIKGLWFKE